MVLAQYKQYDGPAVYLLFVDEDLPVEENSTFHRLKQLARDGFYPSLLFELGDLSALSETQGLQQIQFLTPYFAEQAADG